MLFSLRQTLGHGTPTCASHVGPGPPSPCRKGQPHWSTIKPNGRLDHAAGQTHMFTIKWVTGPGNRPRTVMRPNKIDTGRPSSSSAACAIFCQNVATTQLMTANGRVQPQIITHKDVDTLSGRCQAGHLVGGSTRLKTVTETPNKSRLNAAAILLTVIQRSAESSGGL